MRASLIAATLSLGLAFPAHANLKICNDTRELQSVALGFKGETDWNSKGWWNIQPGDCATVVTGDLTKRYYYYFADSDGGGFRGQNYAFCTSDTVFEIEGDTDCKKRGFQSEDFREIDTGETAKDFTLTLVSNAGSATGNTTKAPGGGDVNGGEIVTQTVTEKPEQPDVNVDFSDLMTDLPAGKHGEPFKMTGVFQGCELENGRAYCSFHAKGIKYRAFYKGPTSKDLMYALEELAPSTMIEVEGDLAEKRGVQRAVVLRSVTPRPLADRFLALRTALQGDWVREGNQRSELTIIGSEMFLRDRGEFRSVRFMELSDRCEGLNGAGPVLLEKAVSDSRAQCFRVSQSGRRLELIPVRGGDTISYRRQ